MTRMTASEAFVETLVAQGVTHVFGIVGSAYMDALDIFPAAGIRFISVAHEQGAGHMADGFSRASGRHGVCIAQNGPGITNFVTVDRGRLLGAQPGGGDHARDRLEHAGPGRLPGDRAAAVLREDHQVPGPLPAAGAHGRAAVALLRLRHARARPGPVQHPARPVLRRGRLRHPGARSASSAAPAGRTAWLRRPSCWPAPSSR